MERFDSLVIQFLFIEVIISYSLPHTLFFYNNNFEDMDLFPHDSIIFLYLPPRCKYGEGPGKERKKHVICSSS